MLVPGELVLICVGVEKKRIMYQPKVDVDKLKRSEGGCKLMLETSAYNHLHGV